MEAILYFIIMIGVLVFVHELGHFLAAIACGVKVETFSIGFGPKLLKKEFKGIEFCLSLIPLGGYVKMFGEDPNSECSEEEKAVSFNHQKLWKKFIIVVMGVTFNFLFAIAVFSGINMFTEKQIIHPIVAEFSENSPAQEAGMRVGDRILKINDNQINTWNDIIFNLIGSKDEVVVQVKRNREIINLNVKAKIVKMKNSAGKEIEIRIIGILPKVQKVRMGPIASVRSGVSETYEMGKLNFVGVKKMVQGEMSVRDNLGGPVMIAKVSSEAAHYGIVPFLWFMAVMSVCLGVINLVPVPALDGGHLLMYVIEGIIRRPISNTVKGYLNMIGFFLLIALMIFVVANDIINVFL